MNGDYLLLIPILLPLLTAPLVYRLRKNSIQLGALVTSTVSLVLFLLALFLSYNVCQNNSYNIDFASLGFGFSLQLEGFQAIFLSVVAFMWFIASLYSLEYFGDKQNSGKFHFFSLMTLAATSGVFLSADLLTTFMFFEWASLCSYALIAHDNTPKVLQAASRYLVVAIVGGIAILLGLFLLKSLTGTLLIKDLPLALALVSKRKELYIALVLMLLGFGAKAGLFPLHIWLPHAHPAAPAPASALLSGILTKTGIFGILVISSSLTGDIFWGILLMIISIISMLLGAVLALCSNDLKKILAYSSISQIGFIVLGIASQVLLSSYNGLAIRGTILHMINHALVKLTLFGLAGVIYSNTQELNLNKLRGWGRDKPALGTIFLLASLNLAGLPFLGGYVSKTLLHESLVEGILLFSAENPMLANLFNIAEILFLIVGGITIAYLTKIFMTIFKGKSTQTLQTKHPYINRITLFSLMTGTVVFPLLGCFPHAISERLAALGESFMKGYAPVHNVSYSAWVNLQGVLISFLWGLIIYLFIVRKALMIERNSSQKEYIEVWPSWLDLEKMVYKPIIKFLLLAIKTPWSSINASSSKISLLTFTNLEDKTILTTANTEGNFSQGMLLQGLGLCLILSWLLRVYLTS